MFSNKLRASLGKVLYGIGKSYWERALHVNSVLHGMTDASPIFEFNKFLITGLVLPITEVFLFPAKLNKRSYNHNNYNNYNIINSFFL